MRRRNLLGAGALALGLAAGCAGSSHSPHVASSSAPRALTVSPAALQPAHARADGTPAWVVELSGGEARVHVDQIAGQILYVDDRQRIVYAEGPACPVMDRELGEGGRYGPVGSEDGYQGDCRE